MSIFRKIFPKSKPKLHLLNREQKLDFAFYILSRYTPIVSQGNEDISLLKDSKDLIKNSILFMYRELLKEPGKKYIEEKYLTFNNENDYKKYLDSLSIMLIIS